MIDPYLASHWRDGARGEREGGVRLFDCWGLVRSVRHELFGRPLLPSYGHIRRTMPREFTEAYQREAVWLSPCEPRPGAIASVFRGGCCIHVAVVVRVEGRLAILETNPHDDPDRQCTWSYLGDWRRRHMRVTFHD